MGQYTLTSNDILYLSFYLQDKDPTTGNLSYHNLSDANSIVFRMKKYEDSTLTISGTAEVTNATLGLCRILVTIPTSTTAEEYQSEIEVFNNVENITWKGHTYYIVPELG